jgi:hypothetical protein
VRQSRRGAYCAHQPTLIHAATRSDQQSGPAIPGGPRAPWARGRRVGPMRGRARRLSRRGRGGALIDG